MRLNLDGSKIKITILCILLSADSSILSLDVFYL